jgi:membrane protease subunit HflK
MLPLDKVMQAAGASAAGNNASEASATAPRATQIEPAPDAPAARARETLRSRDREGRP